MYVCAPGKDDTDELEFCSIRFSPPLVISEEDLQKGIEIIKQALIDLDEVCISSTSVPLTGIAGCSCVFTARGDSGRSREREGIPRGTLQLRVRFFKLLYTLRTRP